MPATTKRGANRAAYAPSSGGGTAPSPLLNALLVTGAVGYGLSLLVDRGRVSWPPNQLLASLYTVAGCLALVGPLVLSRRDGGETGLGDLVWMTAGLLVWVFDLLAALRGEWRSHAWATPLGYQTMGLTILAVLLGGWRCRVSLRGWSWTNVTGMVLGVFWVGLALTTLWPGRGFGLAAR